MRQSDKLTDGWFHLVFAKAVDYFSASRKQKIDFSASTASSKEQCRTTINELTARIFVIQNCIKNEEMRFGKLYTHLYVSVSTKKNTCFSMSYDGGSIDINPLGQIICLICNHCYEQLSSTRCKFCLQ